MKTPTLFREYIWLVNTIYKARAITLAEINRLWLKTEMSEGIPLSRTTFHRHRNAIEDIFGLIIDCNKKNGNKYYISNGQELQKDSVQNWMLSTLTVSNMLGETQSLHHRILLENVPSGDERLRTVINAMKQNRQVNITYKRYAATSSSGFTIEPYCVKLFRQRWYLVVRYDKPGYSPWVCALDRILMLEKTEETFTMPKDWDAEEYFDGFIGVLCYDDCKKEIVKIKVSTSQANYLRSLKLHESQEEVERNEDYSIFTYFLRPTYDFIQELLWNGEEVEVLEPQWLRNEMRGRIERMLDLYKEDKEDKED